VFSKVKRTSLVCQRVNYSPKKFNNVILRPRVDVECAGKSNLFVVIGSVSLAMLELLASANDLLLILMTLIN
jgi:hypothetical protein